MIRRDYIIRMIEDFMALLSRLQSLKKGQHWGQAEVTLDEGLQKLVGSGLDALLGLSDTELLARLIAGEPTMVVREKTLLLASLLKEAGDVAAGEGKEEKSQAAYLKGLHLLLQALATGATEEWPEFVPRVEVFVSALGDTLPSATRAMLMQHYERAGDFGKAEDMLFSLVESGRPDPALAEFGKQFYRRIGALPDAVLSEGNLPRAELEWGLAQWQEQSAARREDKD
jgi:hypothetical protein